MAKAKPPSLDEIAKGRQPVKTGLLSWDERLQKETPDKHTAIFALIDEYEGLNRQHKNFASVADFCRWLNERFELKVRPQTIHDTMNKRRANG